MSLIEQYEEIKHLTGEDAIVPHWQHVNDVVLRDIIEPENEYFLQHHYFAENTFANHPQATRYIHQLDYIYENWDEQFVNGILQQEPGFGGAPMKTIRGMAVCPNTVQMLYHIAYWQTETGKDIRDVESVLEWGGGYGNFARIMQLISPGLSYEIVDTPVYCVLAKWYLENTTNASVAIDKPATIMFLPVEHYDHVDDCDLFVSTWALSECTPKTIDNATWLFPVRRTESILMAFQDTNDLFESAGDVISIINEKRRTMKYLHHPQYRPGPQITNVKQVDYLDKGNYYAVL